MKGTAQFPQCGFSGQVIQILKKIGLKDIATINVLEDDQVRQEIKEFSQWPTIPQLYINNKFIGGADIITEMYETGELLELLQKEAILSAQWSFSQVSLEKNLIKKNGAGYRIWTDDLPLHNPQPFS